jgi:hypothetical protein
MIQEYMVILCPEMIGGMCGSRYEMWYTRYACEQSDQNGDCGGTGVVSSVHSPCIDNTSYPGQCTVTGNWTCRYMRACEP